MLINPSRKPEPEGITEPKDKPAVEEEKLSVVDMICREFAELLVVSKAVFEDHVDMGGELLIRLSHLNEMSQKFSPFSHFHGVSNHCGVVTIAVAHRL